MTAKAKVYVTPTPLDVLCGRGKACFDHVGNQRFRQIIEQTLPKYAKAKTKGEKTFFVRLVVNHISVQGGRFLKLDRDTERWYEGDAICAKSKVGHAFRDALADKLKAKPLPEGVESLLMLKQSVDTKDGEGKEDDEDSSQPSEQETHRERLKNLKVLKEAMDGKTFSMPLEELPDVTDLASIKQAMMRTLLKQREREAKNSIASSTEPSSPTSTLPPNRASIQHPMHPASAPVLAAAPATFGQLKQAMIRTLVMRQQALDRPSKTEIIRRAIQAQQNSFMQSSKKHPPKTPAEILQEALLAQKNAASVPASRLSQMVAARGHPSLPNDALRALQSQLMAQQHQKHKQSNASQPPAKRRKVADVSEQWTKLASPQPPMDAKKMFFM